MESSDLLLLFRPVDIRSIKAWKENLAANPLAHIELLPTVQGRLGALAFERGIDASDQGNNACEFITLCICSMFFTFKYERNSGILSSENIKTVVDHVCQGPLKILRGSCASLKQDQSTLHYDDVLRLFTDKRLLEVILIERARSTSIPYNPPSNRCPGPSKISAW